MPFVAGSVQYARQSRIASTALALTRTIFLLLLLLLLLSQNRILRNILLE